MRERTQSEHMGRAGTTTATRRPDAGLQAPGPSYLVRLFIVDVVEARIQAHREVLDPGEGIGIGGVVFEAYGVLQYVLHQEKCLLNVTHLVFLEKNPEWMVWLMRRGPPAVCSMPPPQQKEGCSLPYPDLSPNPGRDPGGEAKEDIALG